MTKIDIISGFLGAGKTTLIKKLISEVFKDEKLMLIENEFGEIGIDGGFLKNSGIEITEMNSGCICCSLVGDFRTALKDALKEYSPDRIIIEPSGVGKLSDVIKAVKDVKNEADIILNSFISVVDAIKCKMYMDNFGEFFNDQIENANTIILSRTQNISQEKLEEVVYQIRHHNNDATIVTTSWEEISGEKILEAIEKDNTLEKSILQEISNHEKCGCEHNHEHNEHNHECQCGNKHDEHNSEECSCGHMHEHNHSEESSCGHAHDHQHSHDCSCGHVHEHHHADEIFTSLGIETPKKYSEDEIDNILSILSKSTEYGTILRAKGIIRDASGGWFNFDLVPGEYEVREGMPDYTGKLCVIGTNIDKKKIEELFNIKK